MDLLHSRSLIATVGNINPGLMGNRSLHVTDHFHQ